MSEWDFALSNLARSGIIILFAFLYERGGSDDFPKSMRRIGGAALFTCGVLAISKWIGVFSWWYAMMFPMLWGASSLGYGGLKTWTKIRKRAVFGMATASASAPIALINGSWSMFIVHLAFVTAVSIYLGVTNPVQARNEEYLIGTAIVTLPMFML